MRAVDGGTHPAIRRQRELHEWVLGDEGANPGSALEWWFIQGSLGEVGEELLNFMVAFFRHDLAVGPGSAEHGHALMLTVSDINAARHQVSSWVDGPLVRWAVAQPGLTTASNVDRRLLEAFLEEVESNGPPRSVVQTGDVPELRSDPLSIAWNGLKIEQRDNSIHLIFAEPEGGRTWNLRLDPACRRTVLESARRFGKDGHGMELITYPRLEASGEVGGVTVGGSAWLDHQWGGRGWLFADGDSGRVLGWTWLGINLDDGRDLVVAAHRDAESGAVLFEHAYLWEDGELEGCTGGIGMSPLRYWESPKTLIRHAVSWHVDSPPLGLDVRFEPFLDDQEVPVFGMARAIWEGAGRVVGTLRGEPVSGLARGEFYGHGYVFDFTRHLETMRQRIDGHIETFLPPILEASHVERFVGPPRWRHEPAAYAEMLTGPVWDLMSRRGKRWRPLFGLLLLEALGRDPSPYEELISVLAELLHTAALIIDDIQDGSLLRRDEACIHLRYGEDVAISAANTLYFLPSVLVTDHPLLTPSQRLALHETTAEQMLSAHFGQALDVYWSRNMNSDHLGCWMQDSLEEKILQMYAQKTSAPLVALAKISSVLADVDRETARTCVDFARDLGVGFQIMDDIRGYDASPDWRKVCGEDLAEGKMTLVLFHALRRLRGHGRRRLEEIMCAPEYRRSPEGLAEGGELVRQSGVLEVCREQAGKIVESAWRGVFGRLESSEAKILLRALWGALLDQELPA